MIQSRPSKVNRPFQGSENGMPNSIIRNGMDQGSSLISLNFKDMSNKIPQVH